MKFRTEVEPPEPMRGLQLPPEVVESLTGGGRPRVRVTINGHTWSTRIAIIRGRHLIGLSNANRAASGVEIGEQVAVQVELDTEPVTVVEPDDFLAALAADPTSRAAYEGLSLTQKGQLVRAIENAKRADTRVRRIEKTIQDLRERG